MLPNLRQLGIIYVNDKSYSHNIPTDLPRIQIDHRHSDSVEEAHGMSFEVRMLEQSLADGVLEREELLSLRDSVENPQEDLHADLVWPLH